MTPRSFAIAIAFLVLSLAVLAQPLIGQPPAASRPSESKQSRSPSERKTDDARTRLNLAMGMPAKATTDPNDHDAFLILRPQSALSYSDNKRTCNWISWHINNDSLPHDHRYRRQEFFSPDALLPKSFAKVEHFDYHRDNGFDRGHMCPAADRSLTNDDNLVTFLTTNIVPQSPKNNQYAWERFERQCRELAKRHEVFIVCGPHGRGGEGQTGYRTEIGRAHVQVPSHTWKVVLALPAGRTSPKDVTPKTTVLAIVTPNNQSVTEDWRRYEVSVAEVERLTGFTFFSEIDPTVARALKSAGPNRRVDSPASNTDEKPKSKKTKALKGGLGG